MTTTGQSRDEASRHGTVPGVAPGAVVLAVATDDVAEGPAAALALHESGRRGADLVVLHACGSGHELHPGSSWADEKVLEHGQRLVGRVALQLRRTSPVEARVSAVSTPLPAAEALVAASRSASLLVLHVPARPRSHLPAGPGGTVREVAARAECPVVVVRGVTDALDRHGIVVGVDEHGRSRTALHTAMDEAVVSREPVTALHAWDVPGTIEAPPTLGELEEAHEVARRVLSEALAGLGEDYPTVELSPSLVRGRADDVLAEASRDARLLVVARHTSSRIGFRALGRTARDLLHHAGCPLVLVPPADGARRAPSPVWRDVPVGPGF